MSIRSNNTVLITKALAIYTTLGVIAAITYLKQWGMTHDDAVDLIALFDGYVLLSKEGKLV